jgi:hypothetical protein
MTESLKLESLLVQAISLLRPDHLTVCVVHVHPPQLQL